MKYRVYDRHTYSIDNFMESELSNKYDYLIDEFTPELAGDIYNAIVEQAMLGVMLGVLTSDEANAHIQAAEQYFIGDRVQRRRW